MKRKALAKRILAVMLAVLMVNSVIDYNSIWKVMAQDSASGTTEEQQESTESAEDEALESTEEAGTETTETAESTEEAGTETTETAESTEEADTEEKPADEEKTADEKAGEAANAEGTIAKEAKGTLEEVQIKTETAEIDPEILEELPSNEELFDAYVWSVLYDDEVATYGTVAKEHLSETGKILYEDLKGKISGIAENGGSTEFTFTASEYPYSTEADLVKEVKAVLQALLSDCPYEFYWYDKTVGMQYGWYSTNSLASINLTVAGAYRASGTENTYKVDSAKATAAANVKAKANAIVATYKGQSAYARLKGYKDEICKLVSYNDAAAKPGYTGGYGDPWQLIYVFDGDDTTNVVCEGYAKAFQYLCDLDGGLTCYIVTGTMDGGGHMWNVVTLGGNNYIVDVTNCDEGNTTGSYSVGWQYKLFLAGAEENEAGKQYTAKFENFGKMQNVIYAYDEDTISTYSPEELKIASSNYEPKVLTPVTADMITIDGETDSTTSVYDGNKRIVSTSITDSANYTLTIEKDGVETEEIKKVGEYKITLTGQNDYSGTVDKTYTITPKTITPTIAGIASKEYDGTNEATGLSISLDGVCGSDNVTATASYSYDNANVGTGKTVTATGITLSGEDAENYSLFSYSATTNNGVITKANANITFKTGEGAYAFENIYNGEALANPVAEQLDLAGVDYSQIKFAWYKGEVGSGTLLAENPTNAGTYYIELSAPETTNYNSVSITSDPITIAPKTVTNPTIEIASAGVYDGTAKTPAVTAVKDGATAIPSEEYTVAYSNNTNAGDATVTLTDKEGGNYTVSGTSTFEIKPADIKDLKTKVLLDNKKPADANYLYTGKEIKPAVSFADSSLINAADYDVSYTANKNEGTATVTITGKGNYKGQISANFKIAVGDFTGTISYNGSTEETAKAAYYSSPVQIGTSGSDYEISDALEGTYSPTYSFNSENDGSITKTLYFRKTTTGETYKKDVTVNFDKTLPTGTIQIGAKTWQKLLETITFGRYKVSSTDITITGKDEENGGISSGVAKIEYHISEKQLTADALETATFTEYNDSSKPSLAKNKNQIVYAKITDKAGNTCYISSDGLIIDTTAPSVTDVTVLDDASLKDSKFTVSFKVNEVGTYYYLVKKSGETLPNAEDIIKAATAVKPVLAGTGETGTLTETGKAVITATVTGLAPNSSYIVYVVAQDKVYNISSSTEKLDPNTSAVTHSMAVKTKKSVPVVTEAPAISGMYGKAVKDLTITGGKVKAGQTVIDGTWSITDCTNHALDTLLPVGTTDTCTLTFNPTDSNYASVTVEAIRPEISKRPVKVRIDQAAKSYKEENPTFTYTTVAASGSYQDVIAGDDLGITLTTEAGKETKVGTYTIKGTSSNPNYEVMFEGGTGAFSIRKAAAIKAVTETKDYVYTVGTDGEVSIDLAEKMSFPDDAGDCKATVTAVTDPSILTAKIEGDTTLKYEVKPLKDSDKGKTAKITVTVSMGNYKDTTYVLNVKIADTKNLNGSVAVDGNKELIYGQALKELALKGTFTDGTGEGAKTVTGKLTWLNPEMKPAVSVTSAEWQFVPDSKEYKTMKGSTPITVVKADPVITEAPTVTGTVTYDPGKKLSDLTLTGGKAEEPINHTALTGGRFSFEDGNIVPTADRSGYDVIYTPADTANYNSVNVKVKVIVKKATPTIATLPTAGGLVYGQSLGNSSLTGGVASVSGKFDWSSKEIRPQIKDSNTTEYEITFVPEDSVNYESVTARVKVHVDKKILSWDTASVNVLNKMEDGSNTTNLGGTLKLSGVADGDDIGFSYTGLSAVFADAKAGTDKEVTVTVAGKKLTNENYQLPASDSFVLKGTIEKTKKMEVQPELGNNYSLITGDKGKVEVTRKLAQNPKLDTPEKIVDVLQSIILNAKIDGKAPVKENIEVYDVVLLYTTDGVNWTRADAANFPAGGVNVTLPYPASTNRADYKFLAIHMLADDYMDSNGVMHYAGDVETPELTLKEDGISMTLHSLSPIALSWNKIESSAGTGSSTGTGSSGSGSGTAAGSTTSPAGNVSIADAKKAEAAAPADEAVKAAEDNTSVEAKSAATGDSKIPAVSGILILFGCFALAAGLRRRRKEM